MKKQTVIVLVLLCLLVLVDVALGFFLTALSNSPSANRPAYSVAESKARGAFVESVTFEPSSFEWNGKQITIKEAWLEQQTELVHIHEIVPFIWEYYQYRKVEGYNLCFNLSDGWDALWEYPTPFFVVEGKGNGFGKLGTVVLWERVDTLAECPTLVLITDNWQFRDSKPLTVKRAGG